jgi:NAD(P) transhydrogenase subunit alpha
VSETTLNRTADREVNAGGPTALKVGIPKEVHPGERRVAAVPATVGKMRKLGLEVLVESGAGKAAGFYDGSYVEAGARIVEKAADLWSEAELILKVRPPMHDPATDRHEAELMREGGKILSFIWPGQNKDLVDRLAKRRATVLAMDAVPRITRAQKLDALSAMANIAGYKAVVEAANRSSSSAAASQASRRWRPRRVSAPWSRPSTSGPRCGSRSRASAASSSS